MGRKSADNHLESLQAGKPLLLEHVVHPEEVHKRETVPGEPKVEEKQEPGNIKPRKNHRQLTVTLTIATIYCGCN